GRSVQPRPSGRPPGGQRGGPCGASRSPRCLRHPGRVPPRAARAAAALAVAVVRAVCFHGHFYQPPRADAWLGVVEPEASAAPDRDWNARITRECYAPVAAARILDATARLRDLMNLYEWTSFDFGPTLLSWLAANAPGVLNALRRADAASRARA